MVDRYPDLTSDFFFAVRNGEFPGLSVTLFGGQTPGIARDNEESINNIRLETGTGAVYTYLTTDTTLYASSTDNSDTATIVFNGVDSSFNLITRLVTLNGQTPVALSGQMFRLEQSFTISSVAATGTVYISTDNTDITLGVPNTLSKIKSKIDAGLGQGNFASFTVPKDTKAYFYNLEIASSKAADTDLNVRFRFAGNTDFSVGPPFQIFQSGVPFFGTTGIVLPEGTDIDFTAKSPTAGARIALQMFLILIDV